MESLFSPQELLGCLKLMLFQLKKYTSLNEVGQLLWGKNGIFLATNSSSSAIVLADIDLLFHLSTNFVSVGLRFNLFCVSGRFHWLKQSLNSPLSNPLSLLDHRQTDFMSSSVGRHLGIYIFLNVGWQTPMKTKNGPRVNWSLGAILTNKLMDNWPYMDYVKHLPYHLSVDKRWPDGQRHAVGFYINKFKQCPRWYWWIFSNCEIVDIMGRPLKSNCG